MFPAHSLCFISTQRDNFFYYLVSCLSEQLTIPEEAFDLFFFKITVSVGFADYFALLLPSRKMPVRSKNDFGLLCRKSTFSNIFHTFKFILNFYKIYFPK